MKPISKIQKEVDKIQTSLKPISEKQEKWAYTKFDNLSVVSRNKYSCLECGYEEKLSKDWESLFKTKNRITCPKCKAISKPYVGKLDFHRVIKSFDIITTHKGWQVIRLIYVYKHIKRGQPAIFDTYETIQYWTNDKGQIVNYSKPRHGMSRYIDSFVLYKPLELRHSSFINGNLYGLCGSYIYPRVNILPIVKRNGFTRKALATLSAQELIVAILKDSKAETLIKARQFNLLTHRIRYPHNVDKYWNAIKIAIRNNYIVDKPKDWFDYLYNLEVCQKDLNNSKFVCPENLHKAHQHYLKKVREINRKKRLKELIAEIESANEIYVKQKQLFFDLFIKYDNISIDVFKSVKQIYDEGSLLNHCVFENKYYEKQSSLLLSAKVNNEVVETVEVDLQKMKINQSRGLDNLPSEYNEIITTLVENNMKKIKRMYNKYTKQAA